MIHIYVRFSQARCATLQPPPDEKKGSKHIEAFKKIIGGNKIDKVKIQGKLTKRGKDSPQNTSASIIQTDAATVADFLELAKLDPYTKNAVVIRYLNEKKVLTKWNVIIFDKKDKLTKKISGKEFSLFARSTGTHGYQAPEHLAIIRSFYPVEGGGDLKFTPDKATEKILGKYSGKNEGVILAYPIKAGSDFFVAISIFYAKLPEEYAKILISPKKDP